MTFKDVANNIALEYFNLMLKRNNYNEKQSDNTTIDSINMEIYNELFVNDFTDEEIDDLMSKHYTDQLALKLITFLTIILEKCSSSRQIIEYLNKFDCEVDENSKQIIVRYINQFIDS